jgi:hypothetical protein
LPRSQHRKFGDRFVLTATVTAFANCDCDGHNDLVMPLTPPPNALLGERSVTAGATDALLPVTTVAAGGGYWHSDNGQHGG